MRGAHQNNFDRIAGIYDWLANVYSGGKIRACKAAQLQEIHSGARVLYAGVGGGEDAVMAAQRGAHVTVIDLSPRMLAKAAARIKAAGLDAQVEVIQGDIFEHCRAGYYDVVCSNFFLNVFAEPVMRNIMRHLAGSLRADGKLLIADFAPVEGSMVGRIARRVYFGLAVLAFRFLARNALHPVYDYRIYLEELNLRLTRTTLCGPFYWTLTTVRE